MLRETADERFILPHSLEDSFKLILSQARKQRIHEGARYNITLKELTLTLVAYLLYVAYISPPISPGCLFLVVLLFISKAS